MTRDILPFVAVVLTATATAVTAAAQDAALMQPQSYRVVTENAQVRVLEFTSRPGMGVCGAGMHSHPPHVTVLLTPAKVRVTQNGHMVVADMKAGSSFFEPAVTHEVENLGGGAVRSILVELKPISKNAHE
jgi:hypothetical protein